MPGLKFGIELEGTWPRNLAVHPVSGDIREGFCHDGSVSGSELAGEDDPFHGEWRSEPLDSIEDLLADAGGFWPHAWNSTCGMHLHISSDRQTYSKWMDRSFYEKFIKLAEAWTIEDPAGRRLKERLMGMNTYCKRGWEADWQALEKGKGTKRYRILNFCWGLHKTMEIRVLPMMPIEDAEGIMNSIENFMIEQSEKTCRSINIPIEFEETAITKRVYKI